MQTPPPPQTPPQIPPQTIYSYLKISNTNNEAKIYTAEYFQGLEVDIFNALSPQPAQVQEQTGGAPVSGPYKYFNYFFNNIRGVSDDTRSPVLQNPTSGNELSTPEPAPQVGTPQVAAPQVAAPQVAAPQVAAPQVAAPQEIFIFIKNSYGQPAPINPQTLDIYDIERLAKTLTIQIKIHKTHSPQRKFSQIRAQDVLQINNQFIFFPAAPEPAPEPTKDTAPAAVGNFLQELLKDKSPPQNTKLAYFIKRAIEENQLLWI